MPDCVFCNIASGKIKTEFLFRDDSIFVIKDIHPKAPVHLLIIPLQHITSPGNFIGGSEPLGGKMLAIAEEMGRRQGVLLEGFRLVVNYGKDSGQEVSHLHMHLLAGKRLGAMG